MAALNDVYRNEANYISPFCDMRSIRLMVLIVGVDDRVTSCGPLTPWPAPVESPAQDFPGFFIYAYRPRLRRAPLRRWRSHHAWRRSDSTQTRAAGAFRR
ncbi:hypothetical protein CXK91_14350 [Stutzerimonas stutzeri]|uniref:Uncharacterized protein n=1 Tax=Stutzerimonas stutzeri TaxID=316 RepID=A0A2S4AMK6_STUST|nr:hypothetical protein CXK91_14350 [Stutzerimonas stutzeri]